MSQPFSIRPAAAFLPDGVSSLAGHATDEAIRIVSTVLEQWRDGTQRFCQPGEAILAAVSGDEVVGIGGLSQCPHVERALRVRRFYVAPPWRRRGVGRALASELMSLGFDHSSVITCNAGASAAAAPFWETLGFVRVDAEGITHLAEKDSSRISPKGPGGEDVAVTPPCENDMHGIRG